MAEININEMNGATLAYLGDAVLETLVRTRLLETGIRDVGKLNLMALSYVRATKQSEALEKLLPYLSEEENEIYHRGRNANNLSIPKSASALEYRRATGLEALFGYLYLLGRNDRIKTLFDIAFDQDKI